MPPFIKEVINIIKVIATGSSGNAYIIKTKEEILLLELGINFKKIKLDADFEFNKVVGVLVTHEHGDHSKGVADAVNCGIDIYMSKGTKESIGIESHRINIVEHNKPFKVGNFTIIAFDVQHDVNEPFGFLIYHAELGKILFITDSYYVKNRFADINHLLIECNYSEDIIPTLPPFRARTIKSHMSLETLKEMLSTMDLSKTKDITLIHISHDNGEPDRFQREIEELTNIKTYIGEKGLIIK